ncbi:hypothetical protein CBM2599_B51207 [Cupriavidus taiwanensis]|uniref:Uncharacterized protein n=1 Tax=Cupriavidus taiwanensis TaxID=164546 RepID=A0A375D8W2_9BURK|nr:hypothetical protein CBM2599_B51207 [Cupriavidus taiwanensis]SOZ00191.1 hypothetical protein CBM2600_B70217 [Cupriavidus taiwanensis]SPD68138.1 protein of unknown function [Cupriavidus taiwanensis]
MTLAASVQKTALSQLRAAPYPRHTIDCVRIGSKHSSSGGTSCHAAMSEADKAIAGINVSHDFASIACLSMRALAQAGASQRLTLSSTNFMPMACICSSPRDIGV